MAMSIFTAILFLSGATLLVQAPAPFMLIGGLLQAFFIPGFAFLLIFGDRKSPRLDRLFIPLVISPVLLSAVFLGIYLCAGDFGTALRASLLFFYALLAFALVRARGRHDEEPAADLPGSVAAISILFAGLIMASYFLNRYLLVYTDAWHHASVVNEILERGIPPMEPRFPDVPINYMWFYHLFEAIFKELSGLSVTWALGVFNGVVALTFPYLIARLSLLFTRDRGSLAAVTLLAIPGIQAAGWVLWPLNFLSAFFGQVSGRAEVARILERIDLNGAAVIYFLTPPRTWLMSSLDKFITITAFGITLNLFMLACILVIERGRERGLHLRTAAILLVAIGGSLLFHVVAGMALALTMIGGGVLYSLFDRIRNREKPSPFQALVIPLTACAALALTYPYIVSLTGGEGSGSFLREHVHIGLTNILTILAPLVVLFPFVRGAWKRIAASREIECMVLGAWITSLLVVCAFLNLPGIAENKVIFPLFLLLLPLVAHEIVGAMGRGKGLRRALLAAWIAVLFIVPSALTVRGFVMERPNTPGFEKRIRVSADERAIFEYIRGETEPDAVIIEKNIYNLMPVYAHRRNFYLNPTFIYVHNYGEERVGRYGEIWKTLFSDAAIPPDAIQYLRGVGMPFYIVVWAEDIAGNPAFRERFDHYPAWFSRVYANAGGTIYRLRRD